MSQRIDSTKKIIRKSADNHPKKDIFMPSTTFIMKENSTLNHLDLMALPVTDRTLSIENEFMLTDNFNMPTDAEAVSRFIAPAYPSKITFTMTLFCKRGTMRTRLNLTEYELKEHDVLIVLANSIGECLEMSSDCQIAIIAVHSIEKYMNELVPSFAIRFRKHLAKQALIHLSPDEFQESLTLYQLMRNKMQQPDFRFIREALKGYTQILCCNGYQWLINHDKETDGKSKNRQQALFNRFMLLVQEHYHKERTITFYADKMCLTPKYLSLAIHQASGRYAGEWIKDYVILEAKALLKSRRYTVQEVSNLLNFPNASFFGKYFKAAVGCPPRKYMFD